MNVTIKTSLGDMVLELFEKEAPITVENFVNYAREGFYKNTIFHRVIDGFMVQGGGFDTDFNQKETKAPIKNEAMNQISNKRGTIAMARTSVIDSATSQFFINTVDNDFLDFRAPTPSAFGYCVFGKLISGEDVLDKISKVKTASRYPHQDVPVENVVILDVEINE
jgi:cyclophilin family peptidyl-prolyl cis-trans isomerase